MIKFSEINFKTQNKQTKTTIKIGCQIRDGRPHQFIEANLFGIQLQFLRYKLPVSQEREV